MYESKIYHPAYCSKDNFMLYNFNVEFFSYYKELKT